MGLPLPTPCDGHVLHELFLDQQSASTHADNDTVTLRKLKKLLEA
jgi:hypothetical protein